MVKLDYDVDSLIGDLLSEDGFFIDLIGCKEYTFWYLLRQIGIRSYAPVIGTTSFIAEAARCKLPEVIKSCKQNTVILLENISRYFGAVIVSYNSSYKSYHTFIKDAILKRRFVFALYDTRFDTLKAFVLNYGNQHGYALVGFDDESQEYISIFPTSVKYEDLEKMLKNGYCGEGSYKNVLYYLDSVKKTTTNQILPLLKKELVEDLKRSINHWKMEFQFFQDEIEEIRESGFLSIEKQSEFIENRNNFYNMLMVGVHGNFIFKLRCIQEIYNIDTRELEQNFSRNRKEALIIANTFRKASIKIRKNNPEYYVNLLPSICEKVKAVYITEGKALYETFCGIVSPVLEERTCVYESFE